ncbi:MAG TPA: dihydrolipoamide acetyltransferase family protein [Gemmatimonadales bacterium]|jgi:pyruvate dehydrogenase E2 component (dihydrolipoamide acetyltransferase)|nr:dihydrolipoamide acetyltransferase family protein [Gemmatimonadales bacterium]
MATKVVMEALSPTMEEGRLVEWKKKEGEAVVVGDVLAEVETDKAVMELVARVAGNLIKQTVAAGATVPVASTVAWIGNAGESVPGESAAPAAAPSSPAPQAPPPAAPAPAAPAPSAPAAAASPAGTDGRVKASPLARRMAADKGVDLARVAGSGPEGRIVKRDVEQVSAAPAAAPARAAAALPAEGFTDVALTQLRKTIAKRLAQSIGPIPTYYLTAEVDMERAHEAREALQARDEGKFSFNDLIIRAAGAALRLHPWVNAWWQDDHIRQWHDIHIGVAVAIEDGLITPVVRHADRKTLRDIAAEVKELAGRARQKKLMPDEYTGSTFSISNLGMFGIDEFTAVINPPEAAILAVGRIEPKPVVIGGAVVIRRRMRITLSCDHRIIDGATGAAFLKTLVGMLENPLALVW